MLKRLFRRTGGDLKKSSSLLVIYLLFIIGVVLGAWGVSLSDVSAYGVDSLFENYYQNRSSAGFFSLLGSAALANILQLLCCYIFGLCALGSVFCFGFTLLRGFGIGIVSGYLYAAHSLLGVGFFALIMLPGLFISSFVLLFACREGFRFSAALFRCLLPEGGSTLNDGFRLYSIRFAVFALFILLAALCESVMSVAFIRFFTF